MLKDLHTAAACIQRCYFDSDSDDLRAVLLRAQDAVSRAIVVFIKRARVETGQAS